jgi:S-DNA-T family DNA segregation ATPase FtsK/SpoIIIE
VPVGLAAVMALLLGPRFAVFAVMGPVMATVRWLEARRRRRVDAAEYDAALRAAVAAGLAEAHRVRARRRRHLLEARWGASRWIDVVRVGSPHLWERRATHPDGGEVVVGAADEVVPWELESGFPELAEELERWGVLPAVPLAVHLGEGALGLVGDRRVALAVARAVLVQLAAQLGPADLELAAGPELAEPEWGWLAWLPHLVASPHPDPACVAGDVGGNRDDRPPPMRVLVLDGPVSVGALPAAVRSALEQAQSTAVVVADTDGELPPGCRWVLRCENGAGSLSDLETGELTAVRRLDRVDRDIAADVARLLARRADPDLGEHAGLPLDVALHSVVPCPDPMAIAARWGERAGKPGSGLSAVIGVSGRGPEVVDLVADGPHALVAGTTGSGKSELLRTLVVSLAAAHSPDELNFVLVDFKGGGAFDAVSGLPHCTAVVTDLDDRLADRALQSLAAEVRHREEVFRRSGANDVASHRAAGGSIASLVVVVDEFATLAAELPEFLGSLVDVAQRGRSLGVHLVLATQRPAGVVDNRVRANTDLRICLRVQDEHDALDVIGSVRAARLPRDRPGRALLRRAAGDIVEVQTARVGGPLVSAGVRVAPLGVVERFGSSSRGAAAVRPATGELSRWLDALTTAHGSRPRPAAPWLPPLPIDLDRDALRAAGAGCRRPTSTSVPIGLVDDPRHRTQDVLWWDPHRHGILVHGAPCDRSRVLVSMVLAATDRCGPDDMHLYTVAARGDAVALLGQLPHSGGVVDPADHEQVERLVVVLEDLASSTPEDQPGAAAVVVVLGEIGALFADLAGAGCHDLVARLERLLGPESRLTPMVGAGHARSVPSRLHGAFDHRVALASADLSALAAAGLFGSGSDGRGSPASPTGRCLRSGLEVAVCLPDHATLAAMVAEVSTSPARRAPRQLGRLPELVTSTDFSVSARRDGRRLVVPVGLGVVGLDTHAVAIDDVLPVLGAPGTGRTSTLLALGEQFAALGLRCGVVGDELRGLVGVQRWLEPVGAFDEVEAHDVDVWLVDDADRVADHLGRALSAWCMQCPGERWLVAAARPDTLRDGLHWLAPMRAATAALLLAPRPGDGDPLRILLPLRGPQRWPPGRAYAVARGDPQCVQLAVPSQDGSERPVSSSGSG